MQTLEAVMNPNGQPAGGPEAEVVDWSELGRRMWDFLTGREAVINYEFQNMVVEVPRDTGPQAPRATWRLNGVLRITTGDNSSTRAV